MTARKLLSSTAFAFTLSFALLACNSNDTSSSNGSNGNTPNGGGTPLSAGETASLQGAFMAHCYPVQANGITVGYANREINFINETQFTDNIGNYAVTDTQCANTETNETSASGTYTVSGNDINFNYDGGATLYTSYSMPDKNTIEFGDVTGANNGTTAALRATDISQVPYTLEVAVTATPAPAVATSAR